MSMVNYQSCIWVIDGCRRRPAGCRAGGEVAARSGAPASDKGASRAHPRGKVAPRAARCTAGAAGGAGCLVSHGAVADVDVVGVAVVGEVGPVAQGERGADLGGAQGALEVVQPGDQGVGGGAVGADGLAVDLVDVDGAPDGVVGDAVGAVDVGGVAGVHAGDAQLPVVGQDGQQAGDAQVQVAGGQVGGGGAVAVGVPGGGWAVADVELHGA